MLEKRYRLLWGFAKGLHRSQAKALVAVCAALAHCGQLRSFSIAHRLAAGTGVRFKSAVQRFYRLMHNPKFDDWICWSALAHRLLSAAGTRPLAARGLDRTAFGAQGAYRGGLCGPAGDSRLRANQ